MKDYDRRHPLEIYLLKKNNDGSLKLSPGCKYKPDQRGYSPDMLPVGAVSESLRCFAGAPTK